MRFVSTEQEKRERADVCRIALEWQKTPYVPNQRKKGIGVDCLTLIVGVYEESGIIERQVSPALFGDVASSLF